MSADHRNKARRLDTAIRKRREELAALNQEIADRKKYRNEQETQINDLVEAGNTQLMGLQHDITVAKQELKDLKTDTRTLRGDKGRLERDLEDMRGGIVVPPLRAMA